MPISPGAGTQPFSELLRPGCESPHSRMLLQQDAWRLDRKRACSKSRGAGRQGHRPGKQATDFPANQGKWGQRISSGLKKGAAGLKGRGDSDLLGSCGLAGPDRQGAQRASRSQRSRGQSWRGSVRRPGSQAAPLLFLAPAPGSQLPTLSSGLGRAWSWAGEREEVGMHWLRTCPDRISSPERGRWLSRPLRRGQPRSTCRP